MPDERDTQTAATPADGDSTQDTQAQATTATATLTQDPPETGTEAAEGSDAGAGTAAKETRQEAGEADADGKAEAVKAGGETAASRAGQAATEQAEDTAPQTGEAKAEEAKAEEPKAEEPKAEEPKAGEPKAEEAKAGEPKAEEAKAEEPKAEEPKAEEPKAEAIQEAPEIQTGATETGKAPEEAAGAAEAAPPEVETEDTGTEEAKTGEVEAAEGRSGEAKAGEAEAGGAKAEEAKTDEAEGGKEEAPELDDPTLRALRQAKEENSTVSGKVIGWNRGGFHVVVDEVTAFCPASEMELGRPRSPDVYVDREMDFKVAKFQRRGRRVVLSRTEVLKEQREEILARLQPGAVVEGTVTSLPDFGAFIDLGGVEGLVHVSEISHQRVKQPRDVLQSGQKVEVKILKIEQGGDRISLSMKELEPDPWKDIADKYSRGSQVPGKILRHADFGMFVELEPNVEGLVHVSQLAPGQDMKDEDLQPGREIQVWIREVEAKRERISLSLKEVPDEDPWKTVQTRFPEGDRFEGTVESVAPFGVFINLAPGLTGLLPNSQTGLPRGTNANRAFRPGQTVGVQVLTIDTRRKRISLGRPGARVEATKADLQEFRKQQKEQEKQAPSAMEAAFARLGLGDDDEE